MCEGVLIFFDTGMDDLYHFLAAHCTLTSVDQTILDKMKEYPEARLVGKLVGFEDSHTVWRQFVEQSPHVHTQYSRFSLDAGYTIQQVCQELIHMANVTSGVLDIPAPGECDTGVMYPVSSVVSPALNLDQRVTPMPSSYPVNLDTVPTLVRRPMRDGMCRLVILENGRSDLYPYIIMCTTEQKATENLTRLQKCTGAKQIRSFSGLTDALAIWKEYQRDHLDQIILEPTRKRQFQLRDLELDQFLESMARYCKLRVSNRTE